MGIPTETIVSLYDVAAMAEPHQLSQQAHDRLAAELHELRTVGRIEAADRIERAREHGDLKENAEYHSAKEEKAKMEARVAQLAGILDNFLIVEAVESDSAVLGCVVELVYGDDTEDNADKYLIGSIEEAREDLTVISPGSPLGEALLAHNDGYGARAGDKVAFTGPTGADLSVTVVSVQ